MHENEKKLLELVIEYYTKTWVPVGSKFLESLEQVDMAPSTIRKYLNFLEKKWLVYQPYNSAWRIPTPEGVETYLSMILSSHDNNFKPIRIRKRFDLREFIERLGEKVDGVAFGFYENEKDVHYLWVTKLLKKVNNDLEKIIPLMDFIETKQVITYLNKKEPEKGKVNYSFVNYQGVNIVLMYIWAKFDGDDAVIWTVSSLRVDYKSNIEILETILEKWVI